DTGSVHPPIFSVAHVAPGGDLRMWSPDTSVSYFYYGDDQWLIGESSFSGHGQVSFDLFAGPTYLGTTPAIDVRSLDLDPLCVGAVDPYDVAAVVGHYGLVGDPRSDLDYDGVVGPADSALVADHVTDGMHRPLLAPNDTMTVAVGDTLGIWWAPGQGDSAYV